MRITRYLAAIALSITLAGAAAVGPTSAATSSAPATVTMSQVNEYPLDTNPAHHFHGSTDEGRAAHQRLLQELPKGEDLYTLAEDKKYETPAPSGDYRTQAVTPITFDICHDNHKNPTEKPYWFKDRYNACRNWGLEIRYYELRDGVVTYVGRIILGMTFIGLARDRENRIDFGLRVVPVSDEGKTLKDATTLKISLGCRNSDPDRSSECQNSAGGVTKTITRWEAEGQASPVWWPVYGVTTHVPSDKYASEKRGYFDFDLALTATGSAGVPDQSFTPAEFFRCDEADYVLGSKCVFNHVISAVPFDANSAEHGESARFIRDAQNNITLTKPGVIGKTAPGKPGGTPLHRLSSRYDTDKTIDGSRRKVRRTCRKYFGVNYTQGPNGTKRQCDEYPFAATYENSARVDENSPYSFAVRAITGTHNEAAGRLYGEWLRSQHILDYDPFYVAIR